MPESPKPTSNTIDWDRCIERRRKDSPSSRLIGAIPLVAGEKQRALDIGAGALVSTQYMCKHFNHVTAIDAAAKSKEIAGALQDPKIDFHQVRIEDFTYPSNQYDFINAEHALSFIEKAQFHQTLERILASLKKDGVLSCNLFGNRHGWNVQGTNGMFLEEAEARKLFEGFAVLKFAPHEGLHKRGRRKPVQWHEYEIVVRKI